MLNSKVEKISESITLKLNSKAVALAESGKTVYNLTAGQLPFATTNDFIANIAKSLEEIKSFQYSPVAGFPELRSKIIADLAKTRGVELTDFDCVIGSGAKHALYNVVQTILNPDDEVILLAPYWISYPEMVRLCGAKPIIVESERKSFVPQISEIKKAISSKTKAIIINSPNNPSGICYSKDWMEQFAELMEHYPKVLIISDEIYFKLCYTPEKASYFYQYNQKLLERTIIIDGISKNLACTGLRIGYAIAPKQIAQKIARLQGHTASGANSLIQKAMIKFDMQKVDEYLKDILQHLRENARVVVESFNRACLPFYQTNSAFYYLIDLSQAPVFNSFKQGDEDVAGVICDKLIETHGIVMVPGSDFGVKNSARISLVLEKERFAQAISLLTQFLSNSSS